MCTSQIHPCWTLTLSPDGKWSELEYWTETYLFFPPSLSFLELCNCHKWNKINFSFTHTVKFRNMQTDSLLLNRGRNCCFLPFHLSVPHAIPGATLHIDPGLRLAETVRRVCLPSALKAKLMEFVILTYNCHLCSWKLAYCSFIAQMNGHYFRKKK